jgi:endonuclease YncB( thermonuclease family)
MSTRTRAYYGSFPRSRRNQKRSSGKGFAGALLSVAILIACAIGYYVLGPERLNEILGPWLPSATTTTAETPAPEPAPAPSPGATNATPVSKGSVIHGRASVIDGDTLEIRGERIRLSGVDAPESGQNCADASGKLWRCGSAAANALDRYIASAPVSCLVVDTDRYGRAVSECTVGSKDIQDWMARNGHALAYRQYSTKYVPAEEAAHEAGTGIWAGDFVNPADWRKGYRLPGEPETKAMREGKLAPRT